MDSFKTLSTVQNVHIPLIPSADEIYKTIFPKCTIDRFEISDKPNILDKYLGVDLKITLTSGAVFTVQEKFRDYSAYRDYHEFTQEIENGDGSDGEWNHLHSDWYFYGWGMPIINKEGAQFIEWFILNTVEYKNIVQKSGSITFMGNTMKNRKHGSATFVGIPYKLIKPAIKFCGNGKIIFYKQKNSDLFTGPITYNN